MLPGLSELLAPQAAQLAARPPCADRRCPPAPERRWQDQRQAYMSGVLSALGSLLPTLPPDDLTALAAAKRFLSSF